MNSEFDTIGWTAWKADGTPGATSKRHLIERFSDTTLCGKPVPEDTADVSGCGGSGDCKQCRAAAAKMNRAAGK